MKCPALLAALAILAAPLIVLSADNPPPNKTTAKILILTGNEYPGHKWKETSPFVAKFLAADTRLTITIQDNIAFLNDPKLFEYDAIFLNYMNWESPDPGDEARANLKKFVESGKGLVLMHFACGAFHGWDEFTNIAGRVWNAKTRQHDPRGPFKVAFTPADHPITKGLEPFDTDDELYTCLQGEKEIQILATANSKVDRKDYPMAFANTYGKGRVFHCTLGHDVKALSIPTVQELYRRATAWAAQLPITAPK